MTITVCSAIPAVMLPTTEFDILAAPEVTASVVFVDIAGLTVDITLDEPGRILAGMHFGCASAGGGATAVTGEWTISINAVDGDANERLLIGVSDLGIGSVGVRSAVLAAGTYTVVGRHRRTSGSRSVSTDTGQLWAMSVAS